MNEMLWIIAGIVFVCLIVGGLVIWRHFLTVSDKESSATSAQPSKSIVDSLEEQDMASVPFRNSQPPKDIYPLW